MEALAALPKAEYALRFLRIGGAIFLSAGGSIGRCSSERREIDVRSRGVGAKAVLDMLADVDSQPALQRGQSTMRDTDG